MEYKNYKRNNIGSILLISLGVIFLIDTFIDDRFVLIYNGFILFCGILSLINGIWGIVTPIVIIHNKELMMKLSIIKSQTFNLEDSNIEYDDKNETILFSNQNDYFKLILKRLQSNDRERLVNDIKNIHSPEEP